MIQKLTVSRLIFQEDLPFILALLELRGIPHNWSLDPEMTGSDLGQLHLNVAVAEIPEASLWLRDLTRRATDLRRRTLIGVTHCLTCTHYDECYQERKIPRECRQITGDQTENPVDHREVLPNGDGTPK